MCCQLRRNLFWDAHHYGCITKLSKKEGLVSNVHPSKNWKKKALVDKNKHIEKEIAKKKKCKFFQFSEVASLASIPKNDLAFYEDSFLGDV